MEDDQISSTDALGSKVMDSNVVRRKQVGFTHPSNNSNTTPHGGRTQSRLLVPGAVYTTPTKFTPFKPLDLYPQTNKTSDRDLSHEGVHIPKIGEHQSSILPSNNPKIPSTEQNHVLGPHSPTKSSPNSARKLQQVFQQEGDRMDGKERLASLVQSIEAEMQKAGIKDDCTKLNTQLNLLWRRKSLQIFRPQAQQMMIISR